MGAKVEFTDEQVTQVEALAAFLTQDQIADYFGITRRTFLNMRGRDERIQKAYAKGSAKGIAKIASTLFSQAASGNTTAAIFYLKTQAGWRETSGLDLTNSDRSLDPTKIKIVAAKHDRD